MWVVCEMIYYDLKRAGPTQASQGELWPGSIQLRAVRANCPVTDMENTLLVHLPAVHVAQQNTVSQRQPVGLRWWLQLGVGTVGRVQGLCRGCWTDAGSDAGRVLVGRWHSWLQSV